MLCIIYAIFQAPRTRLISDALRCAARVWDWVLFFFFSFAIQCFSVLRGNGFSMFHAIARGLNVGALLLRNSQRNETVWSTIFPDGEIINHLVQKIKARAGD